MPGALVPGTGGAEGLGAGVAPRHGLAQPGGGYRVGHSLREGLSDKPLPRCAGTTAVSRL